VTRDDRAAGKTRRIISDFATNAPYRRLGTATWDGAVAKPGNEPPLERIVQETESNHQAFLRLRDGVTRHEGDYALMKAGIIIDFFPSSRSALLAGYERILDRVFSIHRVRADETRRRKKFFRPRHDPG
jgi:hypothetical protein